MKLFVAVKSGYCVITCGGSLGEDEIAQIAEAALRETGTKPELKGVALDLASCSLDVSGATSASRIFLRQMALLGREFRKSEKSLCSIHTPKHIEALIRTNGIDSLIKLVAKEAELFSAPASAPASRPSVHIKTVSDAADLAVKIKTKKEGKLFIELFESTFPKKAQLSNLGFLIAFYDPKIAQKTITNLGIEHPVFGKKIPSAKQAYELGKKIGAQESKSRATRARLKSKSL